MDWRRGTYAGAALGAVFWAVAALTMAALGPSGDDGAVVARGLLIIGGVSAAIVVVGAFLVLTRRRWIGLALIVCPLTGWLIVGSVAAQVGLS